jgi:hypothetical protein
MSRRRELSPRAEICAPARTLIDDEQVRPEPAAWCSRRSPPRRYDGNMQDNGSATLTPGAAGVHREGLMALIDRHKRDTSELAASCAVWQEQAGALAVRLAVAELRRIALEAPHSYTDAVGRPETQQPTTAALWSLATWVPWLLVPLALVALVTHGVAQ